MALFALSDLHLSLSTDKPMDIFGGRWKGYQEKLKENWEQRISAKDTVLIPGDLSWATYLEDAVKDFLFLKSLPGEKIVSKGNHDYWWTTMNKLKNFLIQNNIGTVKFLHNNSCLAENYIICGCRGWKLPLDDDFDKEDEKILKRELQRLELSLADAARSLTAGDYNEQPARNLTAGDYNEQPARTLTSADYSEQQRLELSLADAARSLTAGDCFVGKYVSKDNTFGNNTEITWEGSRNCVTKPEIIVQMHFPPLDIKCQFSGFIDVMKKYKVKKCVYGHLHGYGHANAVIGKIEGVEFVFAAADYLDFMPVEIG